MCEKCKSAQKETRLLVTDLINRDGVVSTQVVCRPCFNRIMRQRRIRNSCIAQKMLPMPTWNDLEVVDDNKSAVA